MILGVGFALAALAFDPSPPADHAPIEGSTAISDAKAMIASGRTSEARQLLEARLRLSQGDVDAHFLLGILAASEGDYAAAIVHYQSALNGAPNAPRIRLELARTLYLAGKYGSAERQFRKALAGHLPVEVESGVHHFLEQIRAQKTWTYDVGIAIAPDTNINGGSSVRDTLLFGLPFEFGRDARQRSGIGLATQAMVEYSPHLTSDVRLRIGAAVRRRDYKGVRFDDMSSSVSIGPRFNVHGWDLSLLATGLARWYGGKSYQRAAGMRGEAIIFPARDTGLSLAAEWQRIRYTKSPAQDGSIMSISAGVIRIFSPASYGSLKVEVSRQKALAPDLSNWSGIFSVEYSRDLTHGITASIAPSIGLVRYDHPDVFFGRVRKDKSLELDVTLTNRSITLWRFHPTITYRHVQRRSTIDLFQNSQDRLEFGLASAF